MKRFKIIPNHQFDCRCKYAIIEQIYRIVKRINNDIRVGRYCTVVFLNVSHSTRYGTRDYFIKSKTAFHPVYILS